MGDLNEMQDDILEMSDDEFAKLDLPEEAAPVEQEQDPEQLGTSEDSGEKEEDLTPADEPVDGDDSESGAEGKEEVGTSNEEPKVEDEPSGSEDPKVEPKKSEGKQEGEQTKSDASTTDADSAESFRKAILAPFKANGRTMQVKSPEEAIQLMQMGANYNKKMAGLKPGLRVLKMLENNQLVDETKIGYLIDLEKKDPAAIRKLVKESGIDPLDLGEKDDAKEYTPGTHSVDDRELELQNVLESIEGSDNYQKTLDVTNSWDKASKGVLFENPRVIALLEQHISNGIYDTVVNEVERQKAMGGLVGLSDIQAYQTIGNQLAQQGKFSDASPSQTKPAAQPEQEPAKAQPDPKIKEKKRAASPTRAAPATKKKSHDFNPLSMSDEAFEKEMNSALL